MDVENIIGKKEKVEKNFKILSWHRQNAANLESWATSYFPNI